MGRSSEGEFFTGGSTDMWGQVSPSEARIQTRALEVAGQRTHQSNCVQLTKRVCQRPAVPAA